MKYSGAQFFVHQTARQVGRVDAAWNPPLLDTFGNDIWQIKFSNWQSATQLEQVFTTDSCLCRPNSPLVGHWWGNLGGHQRYKSAI